MFAGVYLFVYNNKKNTGEQSTDLSGQKHSQEF